MSVPADRIAKKARIKRATIAAQQRVREIDAEAIRAVTAAYLEAQRDVEDRIRRLGAADGSFRLDALQRIRDQIELALQALADQRGPLLTQYLDQAAAAGAGVHGELLGSSQQRIANEAAQFVQEFVAEDGLALSDRLHRLDRGAAEAMGNAVQRAVITGIDASLAARDYLDRGAPVPQDVQARINNAEAGRVARQAAQALTTGQMDPRAQALRVFRTEINRAHGVAYREAGFEDPDVIGTRFLLSPRHPAPDICDMYASADLHGLGPGVYPKGKSPWPAHPNTLSFEEVVFADEVRSGDGQAADDWIKEQPADVRAGVLGSEAKRRAFDAGHVSNDGVRTPWRVLRQRLQQQGIDTDQFEGKT